MYPLNHWMADQLTPSESNSEEGPQIPPTRFDMRTTASLFAVYRYNSLPDYLAVRTLGMTPRDYYRRHPKPSPGPKPSCHEP